MIISPKQALRAAMKERRAELTEKFPFASAELVAHFFQTFSFPADTPIGGYWPVGSELDIRPLLTALSAQGFPCALPCIEGDTLAFRSWGPGSDLQMGSYGIPEPLPSSPLVFPGVLLVPLLGFDGRGHRLGYGKGFYDRYLSSHTVMSIGIAFAGQEVDHVPQDPHDVPLDSIVTEKGRVAAHS